MAIHQLSTKRNERKNNFVDFHQFNGLQLAFQEAIEINVIFDQNSIKNLEISA